jgi:hypothetical protein
MSTAVILCPWVVPKVPFTQEVSPRLLSDVTFEFESSASAEEMQVAGVMRARLVQASAPLAAHGFSVQLPVRSDPWMSSLWDRVVGKSVGLPRARILGEQGPHVILALLTRRSISTAMESAALALAVSAPQVCVGIDAPVPRLLEAFWQVSSVESSADESLFVQVVDAACRQHPQRQPAGLPLPTR